MEGAQPKTTCLLADQLRHPVVHLAGGFIGESHCQDAVCRHVQRANQIGNAVREHAGFSGARSRQHKRGSRRGGHSLLLLGIK